VLLAVVARGPDPARAASISVGSFTKSTGTAPVQQNVAHGLGETPKALILWSAARTSSGSFTSNARFSVGMTDGTTSGSAGGGSRSGQDTTDASRRMANKAITLVEWGQTLMAEADLDSWNATNFTLNWTTNDGSAHVIHFLAIGGSQVSAQMLSWAMRTSTGDQAVTGVGFTPEVVVHIHAGAGFTSTPPASTVHWGFGIGAMDRSGGQWATTGFSVDASGTSDTQGYQRTNQTIAAIDAGLGVAKEAAYVSMDSDGFTVNFSTANSSASRVFSLALKGVHAKAGTFLKTVASATASQSLTGIPFRPRAVMLLGAQDIARTTPQSHNRFGMGAGSADAEGAIAVQDTDGLGFSSSDDIQRTTKAFIKVNNNTPSIDAEADLASLDEAGFTLSWTTNDAVQTEMLYLALKPRRRVIITRPVLPRDALRAGSPAATVRARPSTRRRTTRSGTRRARQLVRRDFQQAPTER
jgi:hypothetical protein